MNHAVNHAVNGIISGRVTQPALAPRFREAAKELKSAPQDKDSWAPSFNSRHERLVADRQREFERLREVAEGPSKADRARYYREIKQLAYKQELEHFGELCAHMAESVEAKDFESVKRCQDRMARKSVTPQNLPSGLIGEDGVSG